MITRRKALTWGAAAAASMSLPHIAHSQAYPSRPVRIVLPFGAGGVADVTSRLAAEKLGEKLGQRFVIENMPGAGGINAVRAVTSQPPDGYTLGLVTNGTAISVPLMKSLPFDPVKDFTLISMLGTFDLVFVTNAQSKFKTLQDFVQAAKAQPGKLNVGTITIGSTQNLGAELFKSTAGIDFQLVIYRNTPEALVALLRDDIQLVVEFPPAVRSQLQDNKVRALATSGTGRSQVLPNVPTVQEAGIAGYEVTSWNGFFAPNGTPAAVVDTINKALREILTDADVKKRYLDLGVEARPSSPDELKQRLVADIAKWRKVIQDAKIPQQ
jgi:tripartite-type tricarboxylate transporter receptor subunit TctC